MKLNRTGEEGKVPQRTDRFYKSDNYWYYTTREGVDIGPFDSLAEASEGAEEFIDFISDAEPNVVQTLEQCSSRVA